METLNLSTDAEKHQNKHQNFFLGKKTDAFFILTLQANIRNKAFDQKCPRYLKGGVLSLPA